MVSAPLDVLRYLFMCFETQIFTTGKILQLKVRYLVCLQFFLIT